MLGGESLGVITPLETALQSPPPATGVPARSALGIAVATMAIAVGAGAIRRRHRRS
jgi:hypothetical protein